MTSCAYTDCVTNAKERFADAAEHLPDAHAAATGTGSALLAAGAALGVTNLLKRRPSNRSWLLPAILLSTGTALVVASQLHRRSGRIEDAEAVIAAELEALDPLARARVIKDIADMQLGGREGDEEL